jgi:hypothetical protein
VSLLDALIATDPSLMDLLAEDPGDSGEFGVYLDGRLLGTAQGRWRADALRFDEADAANRPLNDFYVLPVVPAEVAA